MKETPTIPRDHLAKTDATAQITLLPTVRGRFGYDPTNPIPVQGSEGAYLYLVALECSCHRPFMFHCISMDTGGDGMRVDCFELICRRQTCHILLYMGVDHPITSACLPEGLNRAAPKGQGVLTRVEPFPKGLPEAIARAFRAQRDQQTRTS
jgi:hypothetical protein